jgi:hypothetical protein
MSITAESWAWEQDLPGPAKLVLVYLGWCANRQGGDCYPSVANICKRTGLQENTVRKALTILLEKKLVEVEAQFTKAGRCTSNLYRLPVISPQTEAPPTPSNLGGSTPSNPEPESGVSLDIEGVTPSNLRENPVKVTKARKEVSASQTPRARGARRSLALAETEHPRFAEFYDLYPRKKARDLASRSFSKLVASGVDPEEIIDGLRRHTFTDRVQYIPHPSSWLNAGSWKDEPEETEDQRILRKLGLTAHAPDRQLPLLVGGN